MRCQRTSTSISVCWNACPMCNVPVTFGGGSWMQNAFAPVCIDGLNSPCDSHQAYHLPSIERGSKLFASSMGDDRQTANYSGTITTAPGHDARAGSTSRT